MLVYSAYKKPQNFSIDYYDHIYRSFNQDNLDVIVDVPTVQWKFTNYVYSLWLGTSSDVMKKQFNVKHG